MSTEEVLKYETQESNTTVLTQDSEYDTLHLPTDDECGDQLDTPSPAINYTHRSFLPNNSPAEIPFKSLHEEAQSFKSLGRSAFIAEFGINIRITDVERNSTTNFLNPNLYVIQLQHGNFEWEIKKRYKHFHQLHQQLQIYRTALKIPLPTKRHKERRKTLLLDKSKKVLPRLPKRPEALLPVERLEQRARQLEAYLRNLLTIPVYKYHHETLEFLEISNLSFVSGLGAKGKEGLIKKRSGGHRVQTGCLLVHRLFWDWCSQWKKRWLVIKESFVAYICPRDGQIKAVLLMDQEFEVRCGLMHTGIHHGLLMSNATRHLLVKCWTKRKAREWAQSMIDVAKTSASDFTKPNRYGSFAPVRMDTNCRWFIDGATYMEAVADVLESAREEIYICDWWLSPEIYMKRPTLEGETWRLDRILQRKARQGIRVYILLYKEVELALGINSLYSKQKLVTGHPNIKVLRHPDHAPGGILLWAHHEKIVCVDQSYAFLGGIDLCYGRWDDYHHRLTDLSGIGGSQSKDTISSSTPKGTSLISRIRSHSSHSESTDVAKSIFTKTNSLSLVKNKKTSSHHPLLRRQRSQSDSDLLTFMGVLPTLYLSHHSSLSESNETEDITLNDVLHQFCHSHFVSLHDSKHKCRNLMIRHPIWLQVLLNDIEDEVDRAGEENTDEPEVVTFELNVAPPSDVETDENGGTDTGDADESADDNLDGTTKSTDKLKVPTKKRRFGRLRGETKDAKIKMKRKFQSIKGLKRHRSLESINSLNIGMENDSSVKLDVPYNELKRTNSEKILSDLGVVGMTKLWHGKDYCNFIVKDFVALDSPYQDLVDRHVTPRMPWHDIGVMVTGNAARDVARHFIQRWNFTKLEKAKYHGNYPWLLPKSQCTEEMVPPTFTQDKMFCASCQILRSVGQWSAGIKYSEESIHNAYVDAIYFAKHFIYIENQFFITQPAGCKDVTNEIAEALYRRIIKAHRQGEVFRVYVVMPLLPAFEGEIGTVTGTAIQAITHWNYTSICRGEGSLLQRIAQEVGDPTQYISFYGLRTHDTLNDKLVTELVYVHSKMMIVDDMKVIIGSANINDRSLIGKRDSEIAVIIKDSDTEKSLMNGQEYEAGCLAGSLRRTLFREHLGLLENDSGVIDVRDPISEHFFKNIWIKTAATNTSLYEKVFNCIPSDEVHSFAQLKAYQAKVPLASSDPETCKELLKKAQGHLVLVPMHFLCMENLTPAVTSKEILMPTSLWT